MDEILGTARLASDGMSPATKADRLSDDAVVSIHPKCAMLFASNIAHLLADQDRSRITTIRLASVGQGQSEWLKTKAMIEAAMAEPEELTGEIMGSGERIRELIAFAHTHLTEVRSVSTRRADQMSALAGAAALAKNPTDPESVIPALVDHLLTLTKEVMGDSALDAFYHLLNTRVDVNVGGKRSIAELIGTALTSSVAAARLSELGIGVRAEPGKEEDGVIGIHLKASQLLAIMRATQWGDSDLEPLFLDLPGASKLKSNTKWRLASEQVRPVILRAKDLSVELKPPVDDFINV